MPGYELSMRTIFFLKLSWTVKGHLLQGRTGYTVTGSVAIKTTLVQLEPQGYIYIYLHTL